MLQSKVNILEGNLNWKSKISREMYINIKEDGFTDYKMVYKVNYFGDDLFAICYVILFT